MRKIILAGLVTGLLITTVNAAGLTSVKAVDLIPSDADIVFDFNTGVPNFLKSPVINAVKANLVQDADDATVALIDTIFADNIITAGLSTTNEDTYILFYCKASDFTGLTKTGYTTETYNGYSVASGENEDNYGSFVKSFCVFTNNLQSLKKVIDGNYQNVASLKGYQNYIAKKDPDSFMSLYFNPSSFSQYEKDSSNILHALIAQGFSLTQTSSGFKMGIYMEGNEVKFDELGFSFSKYNFIPELYKKISGNKLIAYIGANNIAESLTDSINLLTQSDEGSFMLGEIYAELDAMLGINVQNDLLPMLGGEWMLTVHGSQTAMPAVTLVFKITGSVTNAQATVDLLNAKIQELATEDENEYETNHYSVSTKTIQGTNFTEHKTTDAYDTEADPFYLSLGVSSDGLFVLSTHPDLAAVYKADSGLTTNSGFNSYFTNPTESIKDILYVDIEAIAALILENMEKEGAPSEIIAEYEAMLKPWHYIYSKTYASKIQQWGDVLIKVDTSAITGISEMIDSLLAEYVKKPVKFCDVEVADWFYSYVSNLSASGAVQGYPDGCFHPGNEITRAEFIKIAMVRAGYIGMDDDYGVTTFSDLKGDEWYAKYIKQAYLYGFIKGYNDGTVRPNAPVTRAEALQIITNISSIYGFEFTIHDAPFTDVNESDWFYEAVKSSYNKGIVQGVNATTFEPHRNLTRAEAAKMLYLGL